MNKLFKNIKLKKLPKGFKNNWYYEYVVLFKDNSYKMIDSEDDLIFEIEKDVNGKIYYIFDMADRIILDKSIVVENLNRSELDE